MEATRRYRVNVSTSVKGVKTYDCTVELNVSLGLDEATTNDAETHRKGILAESDALVAELDKRYPITEVTK
jgi:hypothetical protein